LALQARKTGSKPYPASGLKALDNLAQGNALRVIDDSGEDYLYPDANFLPVDLPASVEDALAALASAG
jgi:hypothetical protein